MKRLVLNQEAGWNLLSGRLQYAAARHLAPSQCISFLINTLRWGFMLKKLVIATGNPGKLKYFQNLLSDFDLQILSLLDFDAIDEPVEDGADEAENAMIKARYYCHKTGEVCMSDDVGLYIPVLNNEPGVQTRRWGGILSNDISDEDWLDYFLGRMENFTGEDRRGEFRIARAIVTPDGQEFEMRWCREFSILEKPDWNYYIKGLPMSTLTIEKGFNKHWFDLDVAEHREYERENLIKFKIIFKKIYGEQK